MEQFDHSYLKDGVAFKDYDYNNPLESWKVNSREPNGITLCAWQMKAFHYFWIMKQCRVTGEIGLTINMENVPFCLYVDDRHGAGHIFCALSSVHKLFTSNKFPLVIASALIPYLPCSSSGKRCDGIEIAGEIDKLANIVAPSGVLIAALMDELGPKHEGRSLVESAGNTHAWTVPQFEKHILGNINSHVWDVEEFDTLKNDMSFNVVLRRK